MISQCGLCSRVAQRSALTTLTLLVCLLTLVSSSTAEQYTIHIQAQDGSPVEGAAIYGTDGVSYLAERFTDKNGDWPLDTRHIKSANPTIATSHHGQRYRMVPSEFRVSKEQCPGMVCTVTAMSDGPATAVVNWITTNYTGRVALPGMSIVVPYAHYPYPKISDSDGLVLFAVDAKSTACSNQNDDQSDDPYHIVPLGRPGENCSHTTRLTPQFQACPTVADYWGTMSSSCAATPQIDAANNINYEFAVRDLRNRPIPNVQFNLHVNGFTFSGGSVDSLGIWRFSTTQMGVTPQTRFSVIPARTDYDFFPYELNTAPNLCPDNKCLFRALQREQGQGVLRVEARGNSTNLSGVKIRVHDNARSAKASTKLTSSDGLAYFPVAIRSICDSNDYTPHNDRVSISATLPGCQFNATPSNPISVCPTAINSQVLLSANCDQSHIETLQIAGRVYALNGGALAGAEIYHNGVLSGTSRGDGTYQLSVPRESNNTVSVSASTIEFDPDSIAFTGVSEDITDLNFYAVAQTPSSDPKPTPTPCAIAQSYTIHGSTFDRSGERLPGVAIYRNHVQIATSDAQGNYSFQADVGSESWVTPELNDEYFDPAGVAVNNLHCDQLEVNFKQTDFPSVVLSGAVRDGNGNGVQDVTIRVMEDGEERITVTDSAGSYMFSVEEGASYDLTASRPRYVLLPEQYTGDADEDTFGLDFVGDIDDCPEDPDKNLPGICGCGVADSDTDNDGAIDCEEQCPEDPQKTLPGVCGCNVADSDTDGDGGLDCVEECVEDPFKQDPGICGCGVADTDTDGDGVADCIDLCRLDSDKSEPGVCGCGISDIDEDGDGTPDCIDLCLRDSEKSEPGQCGCGVPDTDTDGDGTADCIDQCINDPNKIEPGICGCDISDADTDSDGTCDCNDLCPEDPLKLEPGQCGCGAVETGDTDNDGVIDCQEACPFDPLKFAEGICGCGVPDIDTDNDGTLNCEDQCSSDPNKTEPGQCGCGIPDEHSDDDGVCDCNDLCPLDPDKVEPGICGCGTSDRDSDGDGTVDCQDLCPEDGGKTAPGVCGCGISDADTDGDGTLDCQDTCYEDASKIIPGLCGCGVTEDTRDRDNDGVIECFDQCPLDSGKIEPGECGCGTADTDTDGDGTPDCYDQCVLDPGKTEAGICGCGTPDTDSDGDGVPDCNDRCEFDSGKLEPGLCGCGISDADSDSDGTIDCQEQCDQDPNKLTPGICGCGVSDNDTDQDGTPDCQEECDLDPSKVVPGACGCGIADSDRDADGTPDCQDACMIDPRKTDPGICGCGIDDAIDRDGDGTPDCADQCIADPNKTEPGQCGCGIADTDSDGDGTVDCLDECDMDPSKVDPGTCGCGIADTDTTGSGVPDCIDPMRLIVRDTCIEPFPSPTPTSTPRPTPPPPTATPTATPRPTASATPQPTATATPRPTATATPRPTASATPRPTATSTPRPTATATPRPTATPKPSPGKVIICHVPPGNPSNAHTISVSRNAVRAHLAHGDYLGECTSPTPTPTATATPRPTATPAPTSTPNPECVPVDFNLSSLPTGTIVSNQYGFVGISISADNARRRGPDEVIVFNSSQPSGGDHDLGTPNQQYGGPGIGQGTGNDTALGKVLIIAEDLVDNNNDGLVDDPDDEARGGVMIFEFDTPMRVPSIVMVDIEGAEGGGSVRGYLNGNSQYDVTIPGVGDNSVQTLALQPQTAITRLEVELVRSGAVASFQLCQLQNQDSLDAHTSTPQRVPWLIENPNDTAILFDWEVIGANPPQLGRERIAAGDQITLHTLRVSGSNVLRITGSEISTAETDHRLEDCGGIDISPRCSDDPTRLNWSIRSTFVQDRFSFWKLRNSGLSGGVTLPGGTTAEFATTVTVPNGDTLDIFINNVLADSAMHDAQRCTPPATPTPTPTPGPNMILLSGSLKGKNGRVLSGANLRRVQNMAPGSLRVVARNESTGQKHTVDLQAPYEYNLEVEEGEYKISLESEGQLVYVSSRPKSYRGWFEENQPGMNFAIRFKRPRNGGDAGRGGSSPNSGRNKGIVKTPKSKDGGSARKPKRDKRRRGDVSKPSQPKRKKKRARNGNGRPVPTDPVQTPPSNNDGSTQPDNQPPSSLDPVLSDPSNPAHPPGNNDGGVETPSEPESSRDRIRRGLRQGKNQRGGKGKKKSKKRNRRRR